jgi:hypothetical protein
MQNVLATASIPAQPPPRPNRDLSRVRASTLEFWRAKLAVAAHDFEHFPNESTRWRYRDARRNFWRAVERYKAKQRDHWREHDPLRWRAAVTQIELDTADRWLADCVALGMPDDDARAQRDRLRAERDTALCELGRRWHKEVMADEQAGVVRLFPRRKPRIRSVRQ